MIAKKVIKFVALIVLSFMVVIVVFVLAMSLSLMLKLLSGSDTTFF